MIDVFNPQISKVTKGLEGKLILIYGTNRTGKTLNATKANRPFVVGFERGLNAIPGIPFAPISNWRDWTEVVRQLTSAATKQKAQELYKTIIIDTADAMGDLAADYVCGVFGADSIGTGNKGYGLWKEYSAEITKWLRSLTNAGYTVIFIAHEGEREFLDERGAKYTKIFPKGDKRVIDPICDLCDFICYAQPQSISEKGEAVLSKLYLVGNRYFHAGSRFTDIVPEIPEWDMDKLDKAIKDAVTAEEKKSGKKASTYTEVEKELSEVKKSKWADFSTSDLIKKCIEKGQATIDKTGSPEFYQNILEEEFGTKEGFKVSAATESQRVQVEQLLDALIAKGY